MMSSKFDVDNQTEIYTGPLGRRIFAIKSITLLTSVMSVPVQVRLLLAHEGVLSNVWYQIMLMTFTLFQIITPFMVHFVAKRYVIRLYYNTVTDKYTIVTYRFFPTKKYVSMMSTGMKLKTKR